MRLAKNQENTNQHPESELLLFENYSHSSSTLSSKNNGTSKRASVKFKLKFITVKGFYQL